MVGSGGGEGTGDARVGVSKGFDILIFGRGVSSKLCFQVNPRKTYKVHK